MATDRFYPHVYGWIIDDSGLTAHDESGTKNACFASSGAIEERTYLSFDTSAIDDSATVTDVFLYLYLRNMYEDVGITVSDYQLRIYNDDDRIGAAVTVDDWGHTTMYGFKSFGATPPSTPITFSIPISILAPNLTGDTDIEVRDTSVWVDGPNGPQWDFRPSWGGAPLDCYIDVTYTIAGIAGLFNRFNWKLPAALPGFSNVIAAVFLPSGELQVIARFHARQRCAEA